MDRTLKQAELIRAKITLSKLQAQTQKREAALADLRGKIARTKKALSDTANGRRRCSKSNNSENGGPVGSHSGSPSWRAPFLVACPTPPKPPEFAGLRGPAQDSQPLTEASKRSPDLVAASDKT